MSVCTDEPSDRFYYNRLEKLSLNEAYNFEHNFVIRSMYAPTSILWLKLQSTDKKRSYSS